MASKTISQRISLEGSDDIRKKLEQLGKSGEQAFKQIQDAAKKPITDPAQIDRTKQAIDQLVVAGTKLGQQFQALTAETQRFGTSGAQASQQITGALNQTSAAARQTGVALQQTADQAAAAGQNVGTGLISSANAFRIAAVGIVAAITAVTSALTSGAVETGTAIADQANKIGASIPEWLRLRKAIADSSISNEDFVKGAEKISQMVKDAQGGVARLSDTITETTSKFGENTVKIIKFNDRLTDTSGKSSQAASELAKLNVDMGAVARGNVLDVMRSAAVAISRMGDGSQQAQAGIKLFGDNWKEMVKILTAGQKATDGSAKSLADLGKANRDMTADQIAKTTVLKAQWKDLENAIRATKDQIGALFLDSALKRAEWMTQLVDGSRELFRTWAALGDQKRKTFLAGLGESPTEILFKTLIAVGRQLAGIWRDILVPAGQRVSRIITEIAGSFGGVSKSEVAAFFITATIAAVGLTIALKAIGFALTPLSLLLSLFTGFGPILIALGALVFLFWDQFSAAASAALALVPKELQQMKEAFQLLFKGDFAGFWNKFSTAATSAFKRIKQELVGIEGLFGDFFRLVTGEGKIQTPWLQKLIDGFKQIATDGPGAIRLVANALIFLGEVATGIADTINRIFRTELTGTDVGLIFIVLQITGGLQALASVATIAGVAIGIMSALIGGLPVLAILALVGYVGYLILNWEKVNAAVKEYNNQSYAEATAALEAHYAAVRADIQSVIDKARELWQWLTMNPDRSGVGVSGGTGPEPFASGGMVGGRGTGTSDSNLAWVSRGEHIMPARAVRQPGVLALLEALRRSGGNMSRVMDRMGRFASGGLVLPGFAAGGLVPASAGRHFTVDLRTNAGTFAMTTDEDTAVALTRVARRSGNNTTMRRAPSWDR